MRDDADYAYDHRNRLVSITWHAGGAVVRGVAYEYDLAGRRIARRLDGDGDGAFESIQRHVRDGADLMMVYDPDQSGAVQERYFYGPAGDAPLAESLGQAHAHWLLADHQGSVRSSASPVLISGSWTGLFSQCGRG